MQETVLELKNYSVSFDTPDGEVQAVRNVDLTVKKGEILCIVGESGCGKTVMCRSVMKLLPPNAHVKSGEISLCGENITAYKRKKMEKLCGSKVSMVFQDPMLTLNPTIPVGKQITEAIIKNQKVSRDEARKKAVEMLKLVGIPDAEQRYGLQPHFFSGGMRQRCVLAIALACDPEILFADEATTALDATVETKILDLLLELREKTGISIVFISHDLGAVARIADRVAVMYAGKIIEIGTAEEVYYDPRHPYTWGLLSSLPVFAGEKGELNPIPGMPPSLLNPPPGDAFAVRNPQALAIDYEQTPPMFKVSDTHYAATWLLDERAPKIEKPSILKDRLQENSGRKQKPDKKEASFLQKTEQKQASVLIEARNLKQHFRIRSDYTIHAVDDVSFSIREGEIMALVGETGCGKSTTARTLAGIYRPTGGEIFYQGERVPDKKDPFGMRKKMQTEIQMIFQDSGAALNPRMSIRQIMLEPVKISRRIRDREMLENRLREILKETGLDESILSKKPGELSGGQQQRAALARIMAYEPEVILLDEPFSALDEFLKDRLQQELIQIDTTNILFICGGAFDGLDKYILRRTDKSALGFGSALKDNSTEAERALLRKVEPHDLVKFGLIPELIGRLPVITVLDDLDEDALVRVLKEPRNSLVKQYKELLGMDNVELTFTDEALHAIARKTIERKTGARGLRSVMESILLPIMYEVPSDATIIRVTVDEDTVEGGEAHLEYGAVRKRYKNQAALS